MIGKIMQGKYFAGLIKYVFGKEKSYLLDSDGVLLESIPDIIFSFETQSRMRPSLGNKVEHISLSFSPKDKERLTDEYMTDIANEYLKGMGIVDTQYLIIRHNDREHPHCHIVFNRVNNFGQTIKDSNNFRRNIEVCRDITFSHKLYIPQGKENVKIDRLREPYRTKFEIWQTVKQILNNIRSWEELKSYLNDQSIEISFKYKGTTKEIQGITFSKGKYSFKGSAIDRSFSYAKIDCQIRNNISPAQKETAKPKSSSIQSKSQNTIILSNLTNHLKSLGIPTSNNNKLLRWNDKDEDKENEEIKEEMKRKGRSIR